MNQTLISVPSLASRRALFMLQAASLFNQLLQHFPRMEFAALVKKHLAERAAKGFACWTQFVAMTFCQLAHADSLRDICNGLACSEGKLVHLGITNAPNKSTLSYAQRAPPGGALRRSVLHLAEPLPRTAGHGCPQDQVPLQKQTSVVGLHHHLAVPGAVPLGEVPSGQRGREGACAAGPQRLPPSHRSTPRCQHHPFPHAT